MHAHIHTLVNIYICIRLHIYIYIPTLLHLHTHRQLRIHMRLRMRTYIYIYICKLTFVCMYTHMYTYICTLDPIPCNCLRVGRADKQNSAKAPEVVAHSAKGAARIEARSARLDGLRLGLRV